ncbi:MAG: molybdate ABC transporter substrate-binding protein [Gammaproteobacteria bacterium]
MSPPVFAEQALIAVAANFSPVARELTAQFLASTGHRVTLATGSTGKLYAQIVNGAPFDVLLAADRRRPLLLENSGRGVAGSRRVYAIGRLSLWQPRDNALGEDAASVLRSGRFRSLAIANPQLAPYGEAARQTLAALGLTAPLSARIVMGENAAQAYALVASGNASLGLIATSQLRSAGSAISGHSWPVPASLHAPIIQELILLQQGAENPAAHAFVDYVLGPSGRQLIEAGGFEVPADDAGR